MIGAYYKGIFEAASPLGVVQMVDVCNDIV
jgi:hypothetical protein